MGVVRIAHVQGKNSAKAQYATHCFSGGHLVTLEEEAGQNDDGEDAQGVEDGGTRSWSVGETDVEKHVV